MLNPFMGGLTDHVTYDYPLPLAVTVISGKEWLSLLFWGGDNADANENGIPCRVAFTFERGGGSRLWR